MKKKSRLLKILVDYQSFFDEINPKSKFSQKENFQTKELLFFIIQEIWKIFFDNNFKNIHT